MSKKLKIVFFGTTDFAVDTLGILKENFNVKAVVTAEDKPAGRGLKIRESPIKIYAKENILKIIQPSNLKSEQFIDDLNLLNSDLFVVVAFRMLPKSVWSIPKFGTINLHASLLPDYRGAAPINWAIINGETNTGVTTFFINENIDTGDIIDQQSIDIDILDNYGDLHNKLKKTGSTLVLDTVNNIIKNEINLKPQINLSNLNSANKLNKENCRIDWSVGVTKVYNKVRGLSPYPGATCILVHDDDNLKVIIYSSKIENAKHELKNGSIITERKQIKIAANDGFLIPLEIKIQGKKRMKISDLMNGFKFNLSSKFI
ncbi:methionyl-tRNA formyltransferase [Flavobacteriaceae bacterium]|nr:methionyl-tRNA formyltransferase [Flavobacteriaceae bacterium]MDB9712964.1 methionyl-tRNA formyltransferase [Flavobacteriaceae bacterium]MDC1492291.1 methionyl-tRNA formyltransferase [Flavobacteriaceae bacterium]